MDKFLTIQIPETCSENWTGMSPATAGRYCDSCKKSVIDFTLMSDAQLVAFFRDQNDNLCGRFSGDQLNKAIPFPKKTFPLLKYFFTVTIPAFIFSLKADGQQTKTKPEVSFSDPSLLKMRGLPDSEQLRVITGRVIGAEALPLEGATVFSVKHKNGIVTNAEGYFSLHVKKDDDILRISYVGYEYIDVNILERDSVAIVLKESVPYFGAISYVVVKSKRRKPPASTFPEKLKKNDLLTPLKNDISISPNPVSANTTLTILWKDKVKGRQLIQIFSSTGDLIQTDEAVSFTKTKIATVLLRNMLPGYYILCVTDNNTNEKISKEFIVR